MDIKQRNESSVIHLHTKLDRCHETVELILKELSKIAQFPVILKDITLDKCRLQAVERQNFLPIMAQDSFEEANLMVFVEANFVRYLLNHIIDVTNDQMQFDEFDIGIVNEIMQKMYQQAYRKLHIAYQNKDNFHIREASSIDYIIEDVKAEVYVLSMVVAFGLQKSVIKLTIDMDKFDQYFGLQSNQNIEISDDLETTNLAVMEGIPIDVRVELGSISRKVKEIMEFTPGMILELDTNVNHPVSIIANNQLVAIGDVVDVNENYGVEIVKIINQVDINK